MPPTSTLADKFIEHQKSFVGWFYFDLENEGSARTYDEYPPLGGGVRGGGVPSC
jgi:hypothetical protein